MDEYVGKKAAGGRGFSSKGSGIGFRDQNHEDRSIQYCNRLGCSTRLNSTKGAQIGDLGKAKYVKAALRSMSSKTVAGNSSRSLSSYSGCPKSFQERQKQTLQREKAIAESSNSQGNIEDSECNNMQHFIEESDIKSQEIDDAEFSESNPTKVGIQMLFPDSEELELPILEQVSTNTSESSGVLPSGPSSSDFSHNRQIDAVGKRPSGGENSAAKGKGTIGPSTGRHACSTPTGISGFSRSLPEHLMHRQTLLPIRSQPTTRDDAVSVRTCRASTGDARTMLSEQGVHEPIVIAHPQQNQVSISDAVPESSSRSSSIELPHVLLNSSGRSGSSSRAARNRMVSCPEDSSMHALHDSLGDRDGYTSINMDRIEDSLGDRDGYRSINMDRIEDILGDLDGYRSINMDRIEEVLLALHRIQRDEELTYEQLSMLETDLFSGGLGFHDRHRDMRMDIDNMSYEELLALEEKMGTVSTGLSKDQMSGCLKRSTYTPASEVSGITGSGDDTKCSICLEVYVTGDEVGTLPCEHHYHVACIHQWLGRKNWCPICKAWAIPS
ncbi:probable E3 ubiquitin-protein ligase HIP1 isoform X1 [Phoenix dactylifera]|uniref:RING-type E3 ubiquitin transferase n=1 Tax=Phoenix dactylifera TaxID=42345 RepID=A0A8B7D072_PHODC|nr:probable E3 ubiquitin-protein ligase HIP1 isoform X1 [Phoenix dactylifera]